MSNKVNKKYFFLFIVSVCGIAIFLYGFLFKRSGVFLEKKQPATSSLRSVKLFFWQNGKMISQEHAIMWSTDPSEILLTVGNIWLSYLYEERIVPQKVCISHVALGEHCHEAWINFSGPFLSLEWSALEKWHYIESFLKTIDTLAMGIQRLNFLFNNNIMEDDDIIFTYGIPVAMSRENKV